MELRHLRYFVVVAEMENVSRAATEKLHVAQPSLRRQIRDLEDELGVQLFERTGKRVNLTDAGRLFLREARTLLEHTDEVVSKVRPSRRPVKRNYTLDIRRRLGRSCRRPCACFNSKRLRFA